MRYKFFYILIFFLLACRKTPLEKPGVPIFTSVRIDEAFSVKIFQQNIKELEKYKITGITLNLFFTEDSSYNSAQLSRINNALKAIENKSFPYNFQIEFATTFPLSDSLVKQWLFRSTKKIKNTSQPPLRICLKLPKVSSSLLSGLFLQLREDFPKTKICFFAKPFEFSELRTYDFDEFGYVYDYPPLQMTYKALARRLNPVLAEKIRQTNKGLFLEIYLTQQKTEEQLKNLLRFWGKDFPLNGIEIGSIYTRPVLTDSTSRLGLYYHKELKKFLTEYAEISRNTP